MSSDDYIKNLLRNSGNGQMYKGQLAETRNEQIKGNKATVEWKDSSGQWHTARLWNEDGMWKMADET